MGDRSGVKVFDGVALVACGDVILMLWREPARVHRSKWIFDRVEEIAPKFPDGVIGVLFILPTSSPPDGPARAENNRRLATLNRALRRVITVPLGDAIWTSIVRTVMRGVAIVTGMKNHVVARTEGEAFDQVLRAKSAHTPSRAVLEGAIVEMYRALGVPREAHDQSSPS